LSPFTKALVDDVFMVIEEPEFDAPAELTIGKFYGLISDQIAEDRDAIFTGKPARQLEIQMGDTTVTPITKWKHAVDAIELVVEQGEGTTSAATDEEGDLAHYYRFAETYHGQQLVWSGPGPPPVGPGSYTGPAIPFESKSVIPLVLNPAINPYPKGSQADKANVTFNYTYTSLLKTLHAAFNGQPGQINAAIGLMESCKQQALDMGTIAVGADFAGPSFEYQPTNP
jgi:ferritin-like protein